MPDPPEGVILVAAGDGYIEVWDYIRGERVRELQGKTGEDFPAWMVKGDILVAGSEIGDGGNGYLLVNNNNNIILLF